MLLRKINAVLSLISTFLIFGHAISMAVWMLSQGSAHKAPSFMARALTIVVALHAILSIIIMVSSHKGNKGNKGKSYSKLNAATIVQRISGALMIVFTVLHITGTFGGMKPPKLVHAVLPPLFFTLVLMHVAVSAAKAFITLGIGNAKTFKAVNIAVKLLCGITLIADVAGFYLYLA